MNCIILILLLIMTDKHIRACTVVLVSINDGEDGESSFMQAALVNDCSIDLEGDGIFWEKLISKTWENLFMYDGTDKAISRGGDKHDLTGRSDGEYTDKGNGNSEHRLTITFNTLCDGGKWRCTVISKGVKYNSSEEEFKVKVTTKQRDFTILPEANTTMLASTNNVFECMIDPISPLGAVNWTFSGQEDSSGEELGSSKECGWDIHNKKTKQINKVGRELVKCILWQGSDKVESSESSYIVKGPAHIENGGVSISSPTPFANESYSVTCIASGGDVQISWTLNGQILDSKYFTRLPDEIIHPPNLPYEQTDALKSVLNSTIFDTPTLESVGNQTGSFVCKATVSSDTGESIDESGGKMVELRHKPLLNGSSEVTIQFDTSAELLCNCVAPSDVKYSWYQSKNDNADEIPDETAQIFIARQAGNYSCKASNELGIVEMFFILAEKPPGEGQNVGAIVGGCIAAILVISACLGSAFYIYKKKSARKDEEVAAYAESGNTNNAVSTAKSTTSAGNTTTAPAVYAEINKDRKKKSLTKNTPAAVYSEVNKGSKKKINTKELTGPVYSQVNKPGRPLPQLQPKPGSTNTGPVYSEVNKPKQGRLTPIENQHYDNAGQCDEKGSIHYADVDILRQGNGTKQSHGTKNPAYEPTEYAQIDHRKSAGIVV